LTYAEEPYFPGITFFALPLALLLATAYYVEGRWSLSPQAANGLGIMISVGWVGWVILFSNEFDDPLGRPPWPTVFLPYLGPLLMVLLLVKLFRPKGIRDYWYLHIIGLIQVAVSCVLVVEPQFGLWLLAYTVCAFWSLAIFYWHRENAKTTSQYSKIEVRDARSGVSTCSSTKVIPWRRLGIPGALCRTGIVAVFAMILFLITPQNGTTEGISEILSRSSRGQTGFAPGVMDLNVTGRLEVDDSEAFEVYAENADGSPKTDLTPMTRWRGLVMDHYGQGKWIHPGHQLTSVMQNRPQTDLPDLGQNQFFITYHIDTARSHGLFLAEPIVVFPVKNQSEVIMPYVSRTLGGRPNVGTGLFQYQQREDMTRPVVPHETIQVSYQQVTLPPPGDSLSRPSPLNPQRETDRQMEISLTGELLEQPIKGIRDFTLGTETAEGLLKQLVREEKLKNEDLRRVRPSKGGKPESQPLIRVNRAKVARALSDYLQFSGEYSYSLNLSRQDLTLDPTEDFLRNVKEGHCERFATALVLMLRSAGIPARLVVGFRGVDSKKTNEADGWYVIRQSHSHTWVEALVGTQSPDKKMELRWLTLDPSPLTEADDRVSFSWASWGENSLRQLRNFWRSYILEYNGNKQADAVNAVWSHSGLEALAGWVQREPYWLMALTILVGGLLWWRRPKFARKRPRFAPAPETAFYHRLLVLLKQSCGLTPKMGETPQEFGQTAQTFLSSQDLGVALADLPLRIVQLFYQVRYGRLPVETSQRQEIDRELDLLAAALKQTPRLAKG
jgi:transglutaminase-like putative cysteine protease